MNVSLKDVEVTRGAMSRVDDRPDLAEVEAAVRTMIRWAGDNPDREGLRDTPARVAPRIRAHRPKNS